MVSVAPTCTPSTWNSTLTTPTLSLAFAARLIVPVRPAAKLAGDVSVAVGDAVSLVGRPTVTVTAALGVARPRLSVARAVRLCAPTVVGVHASV